MANSEFEPPDGPCGEHEPRVMSTNPVLADSRGKHLGILHAELAKVYEAEDQAWGGDEHSEQPDLQSEVEATAASAV